MKLKHVWLGLVSLAAASGGLALGYILLAPSELINIESVHALGHLQVICSRGIFQIPMNCVDASQAASLARLVGLILAVTFGIGAYAAVHRATLRRTGETTQSTIELPSASAIEGN